MTRTRLSLTALESREVPAIAVGAGATGEPWVKVYNPDGSVRLMFLAYHPAFTGGVVVATADITGDGVDDVVTGAASNGGPHVKVFDGVSATEVLSFFAFDAAFTGGVSVAVGDTDADGRNDIVVGAGPGGGPHVKLFDHTGREVGGFFAYAPHFPGGVSVAVADFGTAYNYLAGSEIVVGPGAGGGPHVKMFNAKGVELWDTFVTFGEFRGGVNVAAGDVSGDGQPDLIYALGPGRTPGREFQILVYTHTVFPTGGSMTSLLAYTTADSVTSAGGIRVGVSDVGMITGTGPGGVGSLTVYRMLGQTAYANPQPLWGDVPCRPDFRGGLFVG